MARAFIPIIREAAAMKFSELARDCCTSLGMRGYKPSTIATYDAIYLTFTAFLTREARLTDDVRNFTGPVVERFALHLAALRASPNTITHRLSVLRTLANFGMKRKLERGGTLLTTDPTRTFDWPVRQPVTTTYLHPGELAAFLSVPLPPEQALARDFLVETGVRVSEACAANVGDLHEVPGGYVIRLAVKGRGHRTVDFPLSPGLADAIRDRLLAGGRLDATRPLLVSRDGVRWNRTGLTGLMSRIGKAAGITRIRVSSHKLRHTANVVARVAGIEPYVRSRLLGHASTTSLQRYEHLIPGETQQARAQQLEGLSRYLGGAVPSHDGSGPPGQNVEEGNVNRDAQ